MSEHVPDPEVEHLAATLRSHREELAGASGVRIGRGCVVQELTTHMRAAVAAPAVARHAAVDPLRLSASHRRKR